MARPKKPKTRQESPPGATASSRVAILLEDIQGKIAATLEAVFAFERRLDNKIESLRTDLTRRIEALEFAVRKNSEDIRQNTEDIRKNSDDIRKNSDDIRKNSEDIRKNSAEIQSLRDLLTVKADHEALVRLEKRISVLEQRIGA